MSSTSWDKSRLKQFLASISSVRGDLSSITTPPFLLAPRSAVEFPATWCEHPSILVAPASEPDVEKRALLVLKWYLSALKGQQYHGGGGGVGDDGNAPEGVKKPLNAFLGELFRAEWSGGRTGSTRLVCEQVSHHPPVTACYLWNEKCGVRAQGYTRQVITFTGAVHIRQIGHAVLHLDEFDEDYVQTLPSVTIKSLLTGSPYPELEGPVHIFSSSGYTARIEFLGSSLLGLAGHKKNSVSAKLYRTGHEEDVLYEVEGQWSDEFVFKDVRNKRDVERYDTNTSEAAPMTITPTAEQDAWESRRAWSDVIRGLRAGDMQATAEAKSVIEQAQRQMRKQEEAEGRSWEPKFFSRVEEDAAFEKLAAPNGESLQADMTSGIWRFDEDKFRQAHVPFHGDLTPWGAKLED